MRYELSFAWLQGINMNHQQVCVKLISDVILVHILPETRVKISITDFLNNIETKKEVTQLNVNKGFRLIL